MIVSLYLLLIIVSINTGAKNNEGQLENANNSISRQNITSHCSADILEGDESQHRFCHILSYIKHCSISQLSLFAYLKVK
jgi:hypothetical protein